MSSDFFSLYSAPRGYPMSGWETLGATFGIIGDTIRRARQARQDEFQRAWQIYQQMPPDMQRQYYPRLRQIAQEAGITSLPEQWVDPNAQVNAAKRLDFALRALQANPALRDNPQFMAQMARDYETAYNAPAPMVTETEPVPGVPAVPRGPGGGMPGAAPPDVGAGSGAAAIAPSEREVQVPFFAAGAEPTTFGEYLARTPQGRALIQRIRQAGLDWWLEAPVTAPQDIVGLMKDLGPMLTGAQKDARSQLQDRARGVIVSMSTDTSAMLNELKRLGDDAVAQEVITPEEWPAIVSDAFDALDRNRLYPVRLPDGTVVRIPAQALASYWAGYNTQQARTAADAAKELQTLDRQIAGDEQESGSIYTFLQDWFTRLKGIPKLPDRIKAAIQSDPTGMTALYLVQDMPELGGPQLKSALSRWTQLQAEIRNLQGQRDKLSEQLQAPPTGGAAPAPGAAGATPSPAAPPTGKSEPTPDNIVNKALPYGQRYGRGRMLAELKRMWPQLPQDVRQQVAKRLGLTADEVRRLASPAGTAQVPGLITPGNIDLGSRPVVRNADGTYSTVLSMTITDAQGHAILIPRVVGNRVLSPQEAIAHYRETGQHLGIFDNEADANRYAGQLHDAQARRYIEQMPVTPTTPGRGVEPIPPSSPVRGRVIQPVAAATPADAAVERALAALPPTSGGSALASVGPVERAYARAGTGLRPPMPQPPGARPRAHPLAATLPDPLVVRTLARFWKRLSPQKRAELRDRYRLPPQIVARLNAAP